MCEWVWDVPCMAMCCLLVCHGGSLHVPKRLIWAGAWHGIAAVGGELARTVLARDCPKPTDLIRITAIISLSLSVFLYFPPVTPTPTPAPSLVSRPRNRSLPLSCCSFSCSCLTPPSRPYNLPPKKPTLPLAALLPW